MPTALAPGSEIAALRGVVLRLADPLTEQWLLADMLAEGPEAEVAALARRIAAACADMRVLHERLCLLVDEARA